MNQSISSDIFKNAVQQDQEFAWHIAAFPTALKRAQEAGYACLGGQFQFCLPHGIFELYWLNADPEARRPDESWTAFNRRSCEEVLCSFQKHLQQTDFIQASNAFEGLHDLKSPLLLKSALLFVAYFVYEDEFERLTKEGALP